MVVIIIPIQTHSEIAFVKYFRVAAIHTETITAATILHPHRIVQAEAIRLRIALAIPLLARLHQVHLLVEAVAAAAEAAVEEEADNLDLT